MAHQAHIATSFKNQQRLAIPFDIASTADTRPLDIRLSDISRRLGRLHDIVAMLDTVLPDFHSKNDPEDYSVIAGFSDVLLHVRKELQSLSEEAVKLQGAAHV